MGLCSLSFLRHLLLPFSPWIFDGIWGEMFAHFRLATRRCFAAATIALPNFHLSVCFCHFFLHGSSKAQKELKMGIIWKSRISICCTFTDHTFHFFTLSYSFCQLFVPNEMGVHRFVGRAHHKHIHFGWCQCQLELKAINEQQNGGKAPQGMGHLFDGGNWHLKLRWNFLKMELF